MVSFGEQLRLLRERRGLRQTDLVASLSGQFARSTIANVEAGREPPSPRLWRALSEAFPEDVEVMTDSYLHARSRLGSSRNTHLANPDSRPDDLRWEGPFVIERRDVTAVFRESRAPEEVLQVVTLRARLAGVSSFVTKMWSTRHEGFRVSPEVLWGGALVQQEQIDRDGHTFVMEQVDFGRELERGETHSFAVRSWVERAPMPDTGLDVSPAHPTMVIAVHVAFMSQTPASVWAYGPIADESLSPSSASAPDARPTRQHGAGLHSVVFERPAPGESFGIDWSWD
jgi:transcriptional regulator with XRE-family HTH domain